MAGTTALPPTVEADDSDTGSGVQPFIWVIVAVVLVAGVVVIIEIVVMIVLKRKKKKQKLASSRSVAHAEHLSRYNDVVARSYSQMDQASPSAAQHPGDSQFELRAGPTANDVTLLMGETPNNVSSGNVNPAFADSGVITQPETWTDSSSSGYVSTSNGGKTVEMSSERGVGDEDFDEVVTSATGDGVLHDIVHQFVDELIAGVIADAEQEIRSKASEDNTLSYNKNDTTSTGISDSNFDECTTKGDENEHVKYVDSIFDDVFGNLNHSSEQESQQHQIKEKEGEGAQSHVITISL